MAEQSAAQNQREAEDDLVTLNAYAGSNSDNGKVKIQK